MKAIIKRRPQSGRDWYQGLELVDKLEPQIERPDQVKLKVIAAGICGTDVSIYNGTEALKNSMSSLETPEVIVGHEFCGQLFEIGQEARKHLAGLLYGRHFKNPAVKQFLQSHEPQSLADDPELLPFLQDNFYVSAEMHIVCGKCYQCLIGEGHACRNTYIKGLHKDGIFAEYAVVPVKNLLLFAKGEIPPEIIAFMDAIGNAMHTVQSADVIGKSVLVLGAGIQGLMSVAIAKKLGASKIFVTDAARPDTGLNHNKLEEKKFSLAKSLGADFCFDVATKEGQQALREAVQKETASAGVDAVFEMSGSYKAYGDAFKNIRMGGTLSLLGLPSGKLEVDFSKEIIFRGLTLKGIIGRRIFDTWDMMRSLLTSGLSEVILENHLITHDLPLEKFEEGFRALKSGDGLKVILRP